MRYILQVIGQRMHHVRGSDIRYDMNMKAARDTTYAIISTPSCIGAAESAKPHGYQSAVVYPSSTNSSMTIVTIDVLSIFYEP